jgi:hypothetical protein
VLAARYFGKPGVPVVYTAVDESAEFTWCFVQQAATPCVACVFPFMQAALREPEPCRDVPSSIDILKISAGLVSYALDGVLMGRRRPWTYADFHLAGGHVTDVPRPRLGCLVCGGADRAAKRNPL